MAKLWRSIAKLRVCASVNRKHRLARYNAAYLPGEDRSAASLGKQYVGPWCINSHTQ